MRKCKYKRVHATSLLGLRYRGETNFSNAEYDYTVVCVDPMFPETLILRRRSWIERLLRIG